MSSRYQRYTQEAQDWDTPDGLRIDMESITRLINTSDNEDAGPPRKKRKTESLPSVVMLRRTFVILKSMRECIEFRLRVLENMSTYVNVMYDVMIESLKICVKNGVENIRDIDKCFDGSAFIKLFDDQTDDLKTNVKKRIIYSDFGSPNVDRLFLELRILYLPTLEKAVYEAVNNNQ